MRRLPTSMRLVALPAALVAALLTTSVAVAAEPAAATDATLIAGRGTLAASGAGTARVAGSFVLVGSMDGGWVKVSGLAGPDIVRVTGFGSRTRLADGSILFRNVHGKVYVAGRRVVVTLSGPHIRFIATGRGIAWLRGVGTYSVNGGRPQRWSSIGLSAAF